MGAAPTDHPGSMKTLWNCSSALLSTEQGAIKSSMTLWRRQRLYGAVVVESWCCDGAIVETVKTTPKRLRRALQRLERLFMRERLKDASTGPLVSLFDPAIRPTAGRKERPLDDNIKRPDNGFA